MWILIDVQERDGPVIFEKDTGGTGAADPFAEVDAFLSNVDAKGDAKSKGGKRYGISEEDGSARKRARVDDD